MSVSVDVKSALAVFSYSIILLNSSVDTAGIIELQKYMTVLSQWQIRLLWFTSSNTPDTARQGDTRFRIDIQNLTLITSACGKTT